ncbi:MAG: ribonuclease HI [Pyrinomonadaceae bacterium]
MKDIELYCDGSSRGNGQENCRAAAAALLRYGEHMRAVAAYIGPLTNQQAEIVAACVGLEALRERCRVTVHSDSKYLVETMRGAFGRKTNHEFWARADAAASRHEVTWEWVESSSKKVKKHPTNPYQEACDRLARAVSATGEVNEQLLEETVKRLRGENTPAVVRAVMDALRYLAGSCDGARARDHAGFSMYDAELGHRLAGKESLRPGELSLARTLLRKYTGQIEGYNPTIVALI